MTKIEIIGGRYGYISPSGVYSVKTVDDLPFEVEDSEAERLVKRGIATIIRDDNAPLNDMRGSEEDGTGEFPKYSTDLSVSELRAIAKNVGISFKVGTTKEEMVAVLDEHFGGSEDNGESEDDDDFELSAEEPVV